MFFDLETTRNRLHTLIWDWYEIQMRGTTADQVMMDAYETTKQRNNPSRLNVRGSVMLGIRLLPRGCGSQTSPFTSQDAFSFLQRGWPKVEREPAVVYDSLKEESPKLLAMVPAGIHLAGTARV